VGGATYKGGVVEDPVGGAANSPGGDICQVVEAAQQVDGVIREAEVIGKVERSMFDPSWGLDNRDGLTGKTFHLLWLMRYPLLNDNGLFVAMRWRIRKP